MATRYDVAVIGGGPNGLAAAIRSARAGRKVVVLERRAVLGGLCAPFELHPGFTVPGTLFDDGRLRPSTVRRLGLDRHGLELRDAPALLVAEPDGRGFRLDGDPARTAGELAARSERDARAWPGYRRFLRELAPLFEALLTRAPPPLVPATLGERWAQLAAGWPLLRLGRKRTTELLRVAPMCVADFLGERFETPALIEALAAPAVAGTFAGPWSAGTTTNLLLHECAPGRWIVGGPPALVRALESAARAAGVELRTGTTVERILVEGGAVAGVELVGGERIDCRQAIASCDPKRALLELLPPGSLPVAVEDEVRAIRSRGTAALLHLALSSPLEPAARPGERFEALRAGGGHVDELERAFDAVKYRRFSERPQLEIRVPSVADPSLAPAGGAVVSILASFAPSAPEGGWTDAARERLTAAILDRLDSIAPGVRSTIVAARLSTPADLERDGGPTGGQLEHVESALDQLFVLRPTASLARSATPVAGLYLGARGSHGGGGLDPTAGLLAAEALLAGRRAR